MTGIEKSAWRPTMRQNLSKSNDTSIAKAKKVVADYNRAVDQCHGLAKLIVFYCERVAGFGNDIGLKDDGYFDALVRMFGQALKTIIALPDAARLS
jgi:hypothetical protein